MKPVYRPPASLLMLGVAIWMLILFAVFVFLNLFGLPWT